jgi:hypothetical protein
MKLGRSPLPQWLRQMPVRYAPISFLKFVTFQSQIFFVSVYTFLKFAL